MKYVVLLCDGMADTPCPALQGKTPMEAAVKPAMDALARKSEVGLAQTVPPGFAPGSDVANLSVLGYDVASCYTGRSPLEAASIGIPLAEDDVALRCNLVTLSNEPDYSQKTLIDYCAGDISTQEARPLIEAMQAAFGGGTFDFYTGTAYRHCLIWHGGKTALGTITPPHDIPGRTIGPFLPVPPDAQPLRRLMEESVAVLSDHPVNRAREQRGLSPANAVWFWGQGKRMNIPALAQRFGVSGAMISAVDLLKGIGRLAGMEVCLVPGATGYIDTNFRGKGEEALAQLQKGHQLVYIHVEAPDECGHRGEAKNKVSAIEAIDREILAPLLEKLPALGPFSLLILPDHPTPLTLRTHTADPIPYLLYRSDMPHAPEVDSFTEKEAAATGRLISPGTRLMERLIRPATT